MFAALRLAGPGMGFVRMLVAIHILRRILCRYAWYEYYLFRITYYILLDEMVKMV